MEIYQGYYTPTPGPNKPYMFNAIPSADKSTWKFTVPGLDNAISFIVTNEEFDNFKKKVVDNNIAWKSFPKYPGTWTSYDFDRSMNAKQMILDPNKTTPGDWGDYVREGGSTRKQKRNRRSSRRKPTKRRGSRRGNRKTKKSRKRTVYVGGMFARLANAFKKPTPADVAGRRAASIEEIKKERWINITLYDPFRNIPFAVDYNYECDKAKQEASIKGKWARAGYRAQISNSLPEAVTDTWNPFWVFKNLENNAIHYDCLPHGVLGEQPTYEEWQRNQAMYPKYDEKIHNPPERRPGTGERPTDSLLAGPVQFEDL